MSKKPSKKSTKKQKPVFGDPVTVVWSDTTGHSGWMSLHEMPMTPVRVTQVGFFMTQDEEAIYLCQGLPDASEPHQIVAPTAIPIGCVQSIQVMTTRG
jgi:hypothetical protein